MNGLTTKAARERLKQDGENELAAAAKLHPLRMFLGQFRDVMVLILLAATGVSAFLGEISDAVTIILIVLLNAILGFLQEYRTEQTLESLRSLTAPTATVCRDGKWQTIPARELVCRRLHPAGGRGQCAGRQCAGACRRAFGERVHPHRRIRGGLQAVRRPGRHPERSPQEKRGLCRNSCPPRQRRGSGHCHGYTHPDGADLRHAPGGETGSDTSAKAARRAGKGGGATLSGGVRRCLSGWGTPGRTGL